MSALQTLIDLAKKVPRRIVLPEGEDPRIIEGARMALEAGIARPVLLGNPESIRKIAGKNGLSVDGLDIIDPKTSDRRDSYADLLMEVRKGKIADRKAALEMISNQLVFAAVMVRAGDGDGTLGGAVHTTADTVRTALQIIGRAEGVSTVSSFFLMILPKGRGGGEEAVVFSDCGLMVDPTSEQLTEIAAASASSFETLTGNQARVGFLSFSTKGSARHAMVTKVCDAAAMMTERHPDIASDGELQFDAAFVPAVAGSKAPGSAVAGNVSVFIFPNLDAGNIGYKIAQRIGGAQALGPVLQGLVKPANDLSRGCDADDVFKMIAVTVVQG